MHVGLPCPRAIEVPGVRGRQGIVGRETFSNQRTHIPTPNRVDGTGRMFVLPALTILTVFVFEIDDILMSLKDSFDRQ